MRPAGNSGTETMLFDPSTAAADTRFVLVSVWLIISSVLPAVVVGVAGAGLML